MTEAPRTDAVYQFVCGYIAQHGFAPSVREISAAFELNSTSLADYYLRKLAKQGRIKRVKRTARSITVVEDL